MFTNIQSSKEVNTQSPQACEKVEQQEKNFQSYLLYLLAYAKYEIECNNKLTQYYGKSCKRKHTNTFKLGTNS